MDNDKLEILKNIYDSLIQDQNEENKKLSDNLNRMDEIDAFLKSVKDDPESDFRVFSPRSSESIHRDEIVVHESEKEALEKENCTHRIRVFKLSKQIEEIDLLIKEWESAKQKEASENKNMWMLDIQEKERQRIARELHDSSVQSLTHLIHTIELSSLFIDQDPVRAKLELASCTKNLRSVIDEMREIIFNLRPMSFDDLGFKQSIEDFISNLKKKFDTDCKIEYNICEINYNVWDKDKLEKKNVLVIMYRLIQEALTNAMKYSGADYIKLVVEIIDNAFYITVKDNGKGFSLEKVLEQKDRHFGISVMKERVYLLNGKISIDTALEKGTEIKIEIPFT